MPSWWGKSSSKEVKKKANRESLIDTINRKFKLLSEEKSSTRSVDSPRRFDDTVSEKGSRSREGSRSPSPSKQVSRCHSFAIRPRAHPLPLPRKQHSDSGIHTPKKSGFGSVSEPSLIFPLPKPASTLEIQDSANAERELATACFTSDSSSDSDDPSDSRFLSPQASDYENGSKTAMNSPSSLKSKEQFAVSPQLNTREMSKQPKILLKSQTPFTSPKRGPLRSHVANLQIPHNGLCSAPNSSMSSPSRSPMRVFGSEVVMNPGFVAGKPYSDIAFFGSGQCPSPASGYNSGHNSVGGDISGQLFWQHRKCSPESSQIPSPRMTSPGPSSRIHSAAVSPLHPRAGGGTTDPLVKPDDSKQQSHKLPLPPLTISEARPFSPSYSAATTPVAPRSPARIENPISPGSRWKKGRLLGRGTFGHVYLGFNSESGEMCAMKEVTLLSDDAKSKESANQLGQEIALLSRLRHPNIVQYYGTETVEDRLYIYLEYVSGGSIYKILQDYGQLGEIAIRSYTQQILSGLAYLHAKNTVHRDIKGANLLVDPNGRVKLADFGMAKHISGQACPLSLKGSPYWMAPEVIKNSSGYNLAVDIWSLGCTVLEMATTKPPWSQYEGVAAMFKIGNSKELPAVPDHLSEEGKDFIKQCLQRNPFHRPTAAQLLEHPFVKNAAPLERPILSPETPEPPPLCTSTMRSPGTAHAKIVLYVETDGATIRHGSGSRTGSGFRDSHMPRNVSCPVSPIRSPLLHSLSPQHMDGRMSPSPISSPHATSGASTPLIGGSGTILPQQRQRPTSLYEGLGATMPRSQTSRYPTGGNSYQDPKPDLFHGLPQPSHAFPEVISSENGIFGNQFGRPLRGDRREAYDAERVGNQSVLADRVSQKLLKDHANLKTKLERKLGPQAHGRTKGI